MFQSQALTRSDSTLVPCLWCCLYITFSAARPYPKALLIYFFHISDLLLSPHPQDLHTCSLCLEHSSPGWEGGNNVSAPLSPTNCPSLSVSHCAHLPNSTLESQHSLLRCVYPPTLPKV